MGFRWRVSPAAYAFRRMGAATVPAFQHKALFIGAAFSLKVAPEFQRGPWLPAFKWTRHMVAPKLARVLLASAVFVFVAMACSSVARAPAAPKGAVLSISVSPLDPQHTRLLMKLGNEERVTYEAAVMDLTHGPDGLVIDMKSGIVTLGGDSAPFTVARLFYRSDGQFWKSEIVAPR